jgi:Leucine-rich repeat (LRR) protein
MPFEVYYDDNCHKFNKISDIPKEAYNKITAFDGIEMKLRDINNIGLNFPNIEQLEIGLNNIKILDLSYFHNLKILRCNKSKISCVFC